MKATLKKAFWLLMLAVNLGTTATAASSGSLLNHRAQTSEGREVLLSDYRGTVVLVVNVASKCGYTPQYEGLQELHRRYSQQGLAIVAFPANDFGAQEPGSNAEIRQFCLTRYGVEFDLMAKIHVKGPEKHPFFEALTKDPELGGEIRWNFEKFLIRRDGSLTARFRSSVEPLGPQLIGAIEKALAEPDPDGGS